MEATDAVAERERVLSGVYAAWSLVVRPPFYGRVRIGKECVARFNGLPATMSRHIYSEINLHIAWHAKRSLPILSAEIEPRLHQYIRAYALQSKGLIFHEIGGTETHVHVVVSIPPTLAIADWIGKLKGASSHYVNYRLVNRKLLDWQTGYCVVSFGTKDLQWVVNCVRNQKEHHAQGKTVGRLERMLENQAR